MIRHVATSVVLFKKYLPNIRFYLLFK